MFQLNAIMARAINELAFQGKEQRSEERKKTSLLFSWTLRARDLFGLPSTIWLRLDGNRDPPAECVCRRSNPGEEAPTGHQPYRGGGPRRALAGKAHCERTDRTLRTGFLSPRLHGLTRRVHGFYVQALGVSRRANGRPEETVTTRPIRYRGPVRRHPEVVHQERLVPSP
jgi:hypothetical protein